MQIDLVNHGLGIGKLKVKLPECYGGLYPDGGLYSSVVDMQLIALVLCFPINGQYKLLCHCWAPEENASKRQDKDGVPYLEWVKAGYLKLTPGATIDYEVVRKDIVALADKYIIKGVTGEDADYLFRSFVRQFRDIRSMDTTEFSFCGVNKSSVTQFYNAVVDQQVDFGDNPMLRWALHRLSQVDRMDPITAAAVMAFNTAKNKGKNNARPNT